MKLVTAIIRPFKLDEVHMALSAIGIFCITITEVRGAGQQKGHLEIYRDAELHVEFIPKIKIEIAVPADVAPDVIGAIQKAAYTGKVGDGPIFVLDLEQAYRIRTGETGHAAL